MTAREFSVWFFEKQNWRWVVFILGFVFAIPISIHHFVTVDPELWDDDRRYELKEQLKAEMALIGLPPTTAVNRQEEVSREFLVSVSRRYRTELASEALLSAIDAELKDRGWVYFGIESSGTANRKYCREKLDADLYWEGPGGLLGDGGNYWTLHFSMVHRPLAGREGRPSVCN